MYTINNSFSAVDKLIKEVENYKSNYDFNLSVCLNKYEVNQLKNRCRRLTHKLIKACLLVSPKECEVCNLPNKLHAHHPNYSKPDLVIFLCQRCHANTHKTTGFYITEKTSERFKRKTVYKKLLS